jgi:hypothetical protein
VGRRKVRADVIATLVVLDLVAATLAWRDLKRRSESEVRGTKRLWHVLILANPGNSLAYWLVGRKRTD